MVCTCDDKVLIGYQLNQTLKQCKMPAHQSKQSLGTCCCIPTLQSWEGLSSPTKSNRFYMNVKDITIVKPAELL